MSSQSLPKQPISFEELKKLDCNGVHADLTHERASKNEFPLVDSDENYVWVYKHEDGSCGFMRYGANDPSHIYETITEITGIEILGEDDPEFWVIIEEDSEEDEESEE